ncbi:hypothetical protein AVEN_229958-1 [Araneus ventricosus]|uniref:Uncharacterized protein n=1 Tax=Araneus ventricosus TaxID=182803 RepID=A0A4Y2BXL9_ARAVE|nr:hypothetical protein AVEN_229958-1 [Araneus ventricosus]
MIPYDDTACRGDYLYTGRCADRLGTSLECKCLRGITWSFVCWKAGELSVIESAVTVILSDLLSVCVVNQYKSYCS